MWKGGVRDASARCGLLQPCPDHFLPEELHQCATARIPTTPPSAGSARLTPSGVTASTTRRRSPNATGTSSVWPRRMPSPTGPTAWPTTNAGPPGISPPRPSAGPARIPAGWSPTLPPSTLSSASSRPVRKPTSSCSAGRCRPPVNQARALPACSRRSGTATLSTGCSTGTPDTSKAAAPETPGSRGRPPTGRRSAGRRSPGCGRTPSSRPSAGCTRRACRSPTRCRSPAPRCCLSSSATPTGPPRLGWPRRARTTGSCPISGASWWTPSSRSPAAGWRTATCRPTTCSSTRARS